MRIVINGVTIDCKSRSRIQISDGAYVACVTIKAFEWSGEVRSLAALLAREQRRKVRRTMAARFPDMGKEAPLTEQDIKAAVIAGAAALAPVDGAAVLGDGVTEASKVRRL